MSAGARIAAFAAALAVVFVGAVAAGAAIDPEGAGEADRTHDDGGHPSEPAAAGAHPVRGLAVAEGGLRLVLDQEELRRGAEETLSFRILDDAGETVRDFDVEHERRMHLIVVRRDFAGFQHLHPSLGEDGTWSTPVRLPDAGSYRVFADFTREGEPHTLAADLRVDGAADLAELPAPEPSARTDSGYEVRLDSGHAAPGEPAELRFTVERDGRPVRVEPYLGANGHLVALREGDLAFLHVHPAGDSVSFEATFPTAGRYRLFLQFKHAGRVHTAEFTQEVE